MPNQIPTYTEKSPFANSASQGSFTDLNKDLVTNNTQSFGFIEGAIALGCALFGAGASIWNTKQTNKANKQIYEDQKTYNDPSAQRQRLLNAGINPAGTSFQNIAQGANPTQQPANDLVGAITSIPNTYNELATQRKNRELIDAQINKTNAEAQQINIDNTTRNDLNLANLDLIQQQFNIGDKQMQKIDVECSTMLGSLENEVKRVGLIEDMNEFTKHIEQVKYELDKAIRNKQLDQNKVALEIQLSRTIMQNLLDSHTMQLTDVQKTNVEKSLTLLDAEISNTNVDTAMKIANPTMSVVKTIIESLIGLKSSKGKKIGF